MDAFARALTSGVGEIVEILAISIPIIAFMIPIVAIMTHHQRKMAEIIHGKGEKGMQLDARQEIAALREEVVELRQLLNQQVIALDSKAKSTAPPPFEATKELEDRFQNS